MKVVRVITRLNIGGPAIHSVLLTRGLRDRGYQTTLVTGVCEPEDGDMSYLLAADDAVHWIPEMSRSVRPWNNIRALWKLWRFLRQERPLIVHTHTAMAGTLGRIAAILSGVPILVHTFHGNSLKQYFSPVASHVFRNIELVLAARSDAICVVSKQQAEELSQEIRIAPRQKFHVVPLGLDLQEFLALPAPGGTGPLKVAWLGRLVPVKNVSLLIGIIEVIVERRLDIQFLIAGDGPERDVVKAAAQRFPAQVTWFGWQKDVAPLIEQCDVLMQTSHNEGTPLALIQGMAAGRPFVATPVGGVVDMAQGEAVHSAGSCRWFENAVLVPPSALAFTETLIRLAENRCLVVEMGYRARAFASQQYPVSALLENIDGLYRELIVRKGLPIGGPLANGVEAGV